MTQQHIGYGPLYAFKQLGDSGRKSGNDVQLGKQHFAVKSFNDSPTDLDSEVEFSGKLIPFVRTWVVK